MILRIVGRLLTCSTGLEQNPFKKGAPAYPVITSLRAQTAGGRETYLCDYSKEVQEEILGQEVRRNLRKIQVIPVVAKILPHLPSGKLGYFGKGIYFDVCNYFSVCLANCIRLPHLTIVGCKIIRALNIIRVNKLIFIVVLSNKCLSNHDLWALCCL